MPHNTPLTPPSPGDPDRKRVLNVLAQRRYRQRKKEKFAALEAQAKSSSPSAGSSAGSSASPGSSSSNSASLEYTALPEFQDTSLVLGSIIPTDEDFNFDFNDPLAFQLGNPNTSNYQYGVSTQNTQPFLFNNELTLSLDDAVLEVPVLKTMRISAGFARTLGCEALLFDPTFRWTLSSPDIPCLPPNMQPTKAQLTIPHHPLFDILPWPSLRTKLICMFALPPDQRPLNAKDPMALLQIHFDVDDDADGFRVNGEGLHRDDWEIGQAFFRNWWWALDRSIIDKSNAWRLSRGMKQLTIESG